MTFYDVAGVGPARVAPTTTVVKLTLTPIPSMRTWRSDDWWSDSKNPQYLRIGNIGCVERRNVK